jgi:hypothetical protein
MEDMMKKFIFLISGSFVLMALTGCGKPAASDQEIHAMCSNLTKVRGEVTVPTRADMVADINSDFEMRKKDLLRWKASDQMSWDAEYAEALKELKMNPDTIDRNGKPVTPAMLEKRYKEKKENSARKFDEELFKFTKEKKTRLAETDVVINEKQKEFDEKTNMCVTKAAQQEVSQQLAQCRIAAPDKDTYWNKCKDY